MVTQDLRLPSFEWRKCNVTQSVLEGAMNSDCHVGERHVTRVSAGKRGTQKKGARKKKQEAGRAPLWGCKTK